MFLFIGPELFSLAYATSCLCFAAARRKQSLRVHGACDNYQCSPERAPINYITITKSCVIILKFNPPSCSLCHKTPKYGCSHFIKLSFHCVCAAPAALISHQPKPHKLRSAQKCHHRTVGCESSIDLISQTIHSQSEQGSVKGKFFYRSKLCLFELTKNCKQTDKNK
jgi:hypothetical protein